MATYETNLMNATMTPQTEEFFRRVAVTMKLRGVESVTLNFPASANIPSLRLSFAEPQDDEETKSV